MPAVLDLVYGFCATSLIGLLVGHPAGSLGGPEGWRIRFVITAALAAGVALVVAGWEIPWAIPLAIVGAGVAMVVDDLLVRPSRTERGVSERPAAGAVASVKLPVAPKSPVEKTEALGTTSAPDLDKLPLPDMELSTEAAIARRSQPTAEPTRQMSPPSAKDAEWQEPAQSTSPGTHDAPKDSSWEEPGASTTGPLPVMGKRKLEPMDDVDLEELYDEVDAALNVVPDECPHCSGMNPSDAHFCKHCSAPLKPWRCKHCQRVNDIDASFCVRCREPLQMLASPLDVEVIDE